MNSAGWTGNLSSRRILGKILNIMILNIMIVVIIMILNIMILNIMIVVIIMILNIMIVDIFMIVCWLLWAFDCLVHWLK